MTAPNFIFRQPSVRSRSMYKDFWAWFQGSAARFYKVLEGGDRIEEELFAPLAARVEKIHEGIFFQVGRLNDGTLELVFTAEGRISHFIFVEDIVADAPSIDRWKFTAHKSAIPLADFEINMDGLVFGKQNIWFYSRQEPGFPDEIDLVIVHEDFTTANADAISRGCIIFLDTLLGEINAVSILDSVAVCSKAAAEEELIPIEKLNDYLVWRQKEFIERYETTRRDTQKDHYTVLEAAGEKGQPVIAVINADLLRWENKPSHPWILKISILYRNKEDSGQPDDESYGLMEQFENEVMKYLRHEEGYLNIGRQTSDGVREVYLACREFRYSSRCLDELKRSVPSAIKVDYEISKDKYWRSLSHFSEIDEAG